MLAIRSGTMARVDEIVDFINGDERGRFQPGHPADDALLALLVHMAFSDGVVDDNEIAFLQRMLPGRSSRSLREWVSNVGRQPLDYEAVLAVAPTPDDRWKCLRFAALMGWRDGHLAVEEEQFLEKLAAALEMPAGAVTRVFEETRPQRSVVDKARLLAALQEIHWDSVQLAEGDVVSPDLLDVIPAESKLVARIGVDSVEVLALFEDGLCGRFRQGVAYLKWTEIVSYSRGFGLGGAVDLFMADGSCWTLVDSRMTGVCPLLDRLFGAERKKRGPAPVVEHTHGR